MKMSNDPAKYEELIKQHFRSILDISEKPMSILPACKRAFHVLASK